MHTFMVPKENIAKETTKLNHFALNCSHCVKTPFFWYLSFKKIWVEVSILSDNIIILLGLNLYNNETKLSV